MTLSILKSREPFGINRCLTQQLILIQRGASHSRSIHLRTRPGDPRRCQSHPVRHLASSATCSSRLVRPVIYRAAAAFCGKGKQFNRSRDQYIFKSLDLKTASDNKEQSPGKTPTEKYNTGQDAFFISAVGQSSDLAVGIADGVGGWTDAGVNPADFSRALCRYMAQAASSSRDWSRTAEGEPVDLLKHGYNSVVHDQSIRAGGSTACVAYAHRAGHVAIANLGDSGFLHMRNGKIAYQSKPQTHGFNTPYQLSVFPPVNGTRPTAFQGYLADMPDDADVSVRHMSHGDVLVFATDGVWDNLTPEQVLAVSTHVMKGNHIWHSKDGPVRAGSWLPQLTDIRRGPDVLQATLATAIVAEARAASLNEKRASPFSTKMVAKFGQGFTGGKIDDICVLVVIALKNRAPKGHKKTKADAQDSDTLDGSSSSESTSLSSPG